MSNIDKDEINKFSKLAEKWWDPNSEFKPLHDINPLRLNYLKSLIDLKGKEILDIGCGGGIFSESMAKEGGDVTGIDASDKSIQVARIHLKKSKHNINYLQTSPEEFFENQDKRYDVITCMEMLEHVPEPDSIINICSKLLKENGIVIFSTINRNLKSYVFAILGAEYILKLLPIGTHSYEKFIKPSELESFCYKSNLYLNNVIGMGYNPFTKKYFLSKNVDVNYIMAYKKI